MDTWDQDWRLHHAWQTWAFLQTLSLRLQWTFSQGGKLFKVRDGGLFMSVSPGLSIVLYMTDFQYFWEPGNWAEPAHCFQNHLGW